MNLVKRIIIISVIILSESLLHVTAEEMLLFARAEGSGFDISELVLKEAYQRIGIKTNTILYPAERSLLISDKGEKADGEVMRMAGIEKNYLNLIMIPVKIFKIDICAFVKNASFTVNGWESLKPYKIGIMIGVKSIENKTKGMIVEAVASDEINFNKLDLGRIDVVVCGDIKGLQIINKLKLKGLKMLEPPLEMFYTYHYLHKKHADLVSKITKSLQDMEKEGRIKAIYDEFFIKATAE